MSYSDALNRISSRLNGFYQARAIFAPQLAPDFNIFQFIGQKEIYLSKVIAFLLDPYTEHSQGDAFLKTFLEQFSLDGFYKSSSKVNIILEARTTTIKNPNRQIDILLELGEGSEKRAIAFENKPWAGDQKDQIKDYIEHLNQESYKDYCLLYLAGNVGGPSESSIENSKRDELIKDSKLKIIQYENLIDWLKYCEAISKSERIRFFLREFQDFILQQFTGANDMKDLEQIFEAVIESKANIATALKIAESMESIKKRMLDTLSKQLEENMEVLHWQVDSREVHISKENGWSIFFFNNQQRYFLTFAFEFTNCRGFYWGLVKADQNYDDLECVRKRLDEQIEKGEFNKASIWYKRVSGEYGNWSNSEEPWADIVLNEKLAGWIVERSKNVYLALKGTNQNGVDSLLEKLK